MVSVGIVTAPSIQVKFHGCWKGENGTINDAELNVSQPTAFEPCSADATFTLCNVTIGIDYHWQRQENQTFKGKLNVIRDGELLTAVNVISIEDYLVSVISSEMNPNANVEFLKAAAVISRSWVRRQQINRLAEHMSPTNQLGHKHTNDTIVEWHDHQDHTLFDVCADDHCQRYQGLTRIINPNASLAVRETCGQVLTYSDEICDCRFSKCCGGTTELYDTCWEDKSVPYLQAVPDTDPKDGHVFCNTTDKAVLSQVLNSYDQETTHFYRWTVSYTQQELQQLLFKKLNHHFGQIKALTPIHRGPSGRISLLKIEGTDDYLYIGKELTIRSALSESHLYSSAFCVEPADINPEGIPQRFILHGKGWGHGVGLCQIGAAVMASEGYDYQQILQHYYPGTTLTTLRVTDKTK